MQEYQLFTLIGCTPDTISSIQTIPNIVKVISIQNLSKSGCIEANSFLNSQHFGNLY